MARKVVKAPLATRAAHDPALLRRALANPGLRSKLPDNLLTADLRQQRGQNAYNNAPVVPGSSLTNRQADTQAQTATQVQYGPQEAALKGIARDTPGWYDQYLGALNDHTRNVQAYQAGAQAALQNTQQGITGLSQQGLSDLQGQAQASAAPRGATAADQSGTASNAAAIRQALMGSFMAQQGSQGASANTYADTLANVVAPTQKLSAIAQSRGKLSDLSRQEGAFKQSQRDTIAQNESKNVLAGQALGINAQKAATTAKNQAANIDLKRGVDPVTGQPLPQKAPKGYGPGAPGLNKYGFTYDQWTAMDPKAQAKERAGKGKNAAGAGPNWLPNAQMSEGLSQLPALKNFATKAKAGQPFLAGHGKQRPLGRAEAVGKLTSAVAAPKDPALMSATLDAVYDGHLSASTVKALIAAGYMPSKVARTLGVPTASGYKPTKQRFPPLNLKPLKHV
jgi:hypothetical protein